MDLAAFEQRDLIHAERLGQLHADVRKAFGVLR
jgi:hypothetical protein